MGGTGLSNRAWMPLHIADYLADTGHLTATEHGAYLLLIMHYWQHGSLPVEERMICRIAKMDAEQWAESRDVLAMLFGSGWTHKRIDAELAKADEIIEKRRHAGKARQGKSKTEAQGEQAGSTCSANAHTRAGTPLTNNLSEPSGSDAPSAVDAREVLWRDGLSILKAISGKTDSGARQLLGKWLKASRDDCALVMSKIVAARDNRVGEPVSWITAALSPPGTSPPKAGVVGMAHHILESENHGSEGIFGDYRHVELLPAAGGDGQRDAPENILGSPPGREFAGHH